MFVRQDIPTAQQIVQSNHASFEVARRLPSEFTDIPNLVLIGVPDKSALFRVVKKLETNNISHQVVVEPDDNMGLSAVATFPLSQEERRALSNYRLWKESSSRGDVIIPPSARQEAPNAICG